MVVDRFCGSEGITGVAISTPTGTLSAILICAAYYISNRWCREAI